MWESRVLQRAFERLELHEGKLSRAVLRGGGGGDVTSLPDTWVGNHPGLPGPPRPDPAEALKRISDKSLFSMVLGSPDHRITHQLRPINMNGRSILSEMSRQALFQTPNLCILCRSAGNVRRRSFVCAIPDVG